MVVKKKIASSLVPAEQIERQIYLIRGQKVMLDSDLAMLYGVLTKNLNLAVRRNVLRFPQDFMFQLTEEETQSLRLQIATSNKGRGGRRYVPFVFTEQGVAMLSSVLKSDRAVQMNVFIIRAFVKLREMIATNVDLARKIDALEKKFKGHDDDIQIIFQAIKKLLEPPPVPPRKPIGFAVDK